MRRTVWFRGELGRLLNDLSRRTGCSFNSLVNEAIEQYVKGCSNERLRLIAEKVALKREEAELRNDWRLISRSGAYLPSYVDKVVKPKDSPFRIGSVPLAALSKEEHDIFLRIAHRREAIARRIVEIEGLLLPKDKFRVESDSSWSCRHDKNNRNGGEKLDGQNP